MLRCPFPCVIDGKVVLPGNLLQITFYGRCCTLKVSKVKGTDGVLLKMQNNSVFNHSQDLSLAEFDCDLDLSTQLDKLVMEDNPEGVFTSTPCKPVDHGVLCAAVCDERPSTAEVSSFSENVSTSILHSESTRSKDNEKCFANDGLLQPGQAGTPLNSDTFYFISSRTRISFSDSQTKLAEECNSEPKVTYASIGGLNSELQTIREMIELPLKQPDLFRSYGRKSAKWFTLPGEKQQFCKFTS